MKNFSDAITVISFFAIIIMFAVSTVFFQQNVSFREEISTSKEISLSEGKEVNVSVKESVSGFVEDNFPMSDNWRTLYANLLVWTGRERFGNVYLADGRLIKLCGDRKADTDSNVSLINDFAAAADKPVYVMLAPTAEGIYSSGSSQIASRLNQKEQIDDIYLKLDKKIGTIDAYYPLYSARDEYVYYRTEDLWTSFGAYYAYAEAIKQMGFQPMTLSNYDQEYALSSFTGSLYERVMYSGIAPDRINIFRSKYKSSVERVELEKNKEVKTAKSVYFRSALKTDKATDIYLLGDGYERVSVYTSAEGAPKLLIIKGSFANTLVPFLTPHYSEITLADPKLIKSCGGKLEDKVNIDDYDQILILYDADSFAHEDSFDILS